MRKQNKRFAAVMALTLALTMVFSSVSVNAATKKVKSMTLSAKSVTLEINDTKKVTVKKVTPAKASKKVTWKSSNKAVATVSTTGVITAKAEGKAIITATSKSNKKVKRTVKVTVKPFEQHYVNAETVYNALRSDVVIIDAREDAVYAAGHIPSAVHANSKNGDVKAAYDKVVADYGKQATYYIVCNSGNSYADEATNQLMARGVATNKIFTLGGDDSKKSNEGGWKAWIKHYPEFVAKSGPSADGGKFVFENNMTIENVKKDIESGKKLTIVDVRDAASYKAGFIPGAIDASLCEIKDGQKSKVSEEDAIAALKPIVDANPNGIYAFACFTGNSYADYARNIVVNKLGVKETQVVCIIGGNQAWADAKYDFEGYNYVNADYVNGKLGDANTVLVDCRESSDFKTSHLPGAVSASQLSVVKKEMTDGDAFANTKSVVDKFGKDKEYVLICYSGNRYAQACTKNLRICGVANANIKTLGGDDSKISPNGGMKAWNAKGYALSGEKGGIKYDGAAKTVSFTCKVTGNKKPAHWFIVNETGSMAGKTLLTTKVTTDDFYDALVAVAGKNVWNDVAGNEFGADESIDDQLNKNVGNKNFAKFDLRVSWGGKTFPLSKVVTKPTYKGQAYKGTYDIAFAGNLDNQHKAKTGCITCFGGCYMGITSGHDTPMMIEYTPANLPKAGKTVTVTYTVK